MRADNVVLTVSTGPIGSAYATVFAEFLVNNVWTEKMFFVYGTYRLTEQVRSRPPLDLTSVFSLYDHLRRELAP